MRLGHVSFIAYFSRRNLAHRLELSLVLLHLGLTMAIRIQDKSSSRWYQVAHVVIFFIAIRLASVDLIQDG